MEIDAKLENLGLTSKEIKAYLALLKLQSANPHQIAKEAKVERTTIYKILDDLTERGLISRSIAGKKLSYFAESPEMLKNMLSEQQSIVSQILPYLSALQGSKGSRPIIKFYENKEGIRKVLTESLNSREKIRRDFAFVENVVDFFGLRFIHKQIEDRIKRGIHVCSLRRKPRGNKISEKDWYLKKDNKELLREVRYLPASIEFEPLIIIYDHVVAVMSSQKESYAFVIESREFSQAMKSLFDIAWSSAKKQ
ncbi:MAG: helix-turn-helix domain-containing protein [bacterium]|nr:helix-turn-helix domain-containing protein [bacterium]